MTPRLIAAALDAAPIAGLTHGLGFGPEATPPEDGEDPYLCLCAARAEVCLYVNADDLGEVIAVARPALAIFGDRYATLIAAIDAALETP